jgi:DNA-binding MarR family transcriptional regulator
MEPGKPETRDRGEPAPLTEVERRCWGAFITVATAVTRRLDRELQRDHGLTLDDLGIIAILAESDTHQERFGELAARLRLPKANVTYRFQRLEERNLVDRAPSPDDRRGAYARLTPTGLALWERASRDYLRFIRRHFLDPLDHNTIDAIGSSLLAVIDAHPSGSEGLRP